MMVKLGMLIVKTKIGQLPVLVILILIQMKSKCHCKYINREIISSQKNAPFSSTDSFSNPKFFCSKKTNECTRRGAVCSSSCCTCKCREHIPNFYSLQKGCVSSTVINNEQGMPLHTLPCIIFYSYCLVKLIDINLPVYQCKSNDTIDQNKPDEGINHCVTSLSIRIDIVVGGER